MYGSSLRSVTRSPRASRSAPTDALARPFPIDDTTPPVTNTYFVGFRLTAYEVYYDGAVTVIANRYELGDVLGSGGFATVYRARDRAERRDVAVKVIPKAADTAEEGVERFRLEALALSHLQSLEWDSGRRFFRWH